MSAPQHDPKYLPKAAHIKIPPAAQMYKQTPLPFMKRNRVRNSIFALGITTFCLGVANYSFGVTRRDDFTKDPHFAEVMSEIKREEIMGSNRLMERRSSGGGI